MSYNNGYPMYTTVCPACSKPLIMCYDPGYPDSKEEPGMPPDWYLYNTDKAQYEVEHDECLTLETWEALKAEATDSPEYRAYEEAESQEQAPCQP